MRSFLNVASLALPRPQSTVVSPESTSLTYRRRARRLHSAVPARPGEGLNRPRRYSDARTGSQRFTDRAAIRQRHRLDYRQRSDWWRHLHGPHRRIPGGRRTNLPAARNRKLATDCLRNLVRQIKRPPVVTNDGGRFCFGSVADLRALSENQPCGELNVAWATAPEKRIADADVGRDRNRQKAGAASGYRIDAGSKVRSETRQQRIGKIRVVENVEDLGAQLNLHMFGDGRVFEDREVDVSVTRAAQSVATERTKVPGSR